MRRFATVVAALGLACAHLPGPATRPALPTIPPPADVEPLLPPKRPAMTVNPKAPTFPTQPLDAGACPGYPAGILLSDWSYARMLDAKSERDRLVVETAALRKLRAAEHRLCLEAEQVYLGRIAQLEEGISHEKRWAAWKMGLAFLAGGVLVLGTTYAGRR